MPKTFLLFLKLGQKQSFFTVFKTDRTENSYSCFSLFLKLCLKQTVFLVFEPTPRCFLQLGVGWYGAPGLKPLLLENVLAVLICEKRGLPYTIVISTSNNTILRREKKMSHFRLIRTFSDQVHATGYAMLPVGCSDLVHRFATREDCVSACS